MLHTRKATSAFTLLELIVALVILAILAAIAIPTFGTVIDRSHDRSTETSLTSYARSVQAHVGFRGDQTLTGEDFAEAAADFTQIAAAPGTSAESYDVLVRSHPTRADRFDDHKLAVISYALSADGGAAGVAAISASGNCVGIRMTTTQTTPVPMPDAAELCTGRTALDTTKPEKGDPLDPTNPDALQTPDLQHSSRTTSTATVTWATIPGAASYLVEVSDTETLSSVTKTTTTSQSHTIPTTWDTPKYVRVSAIAGSSTSTPSRTLRVVGALEAPQDTALQIEDATATISWATVAGATGYRIYQNGSAAFVRDVQGGSTTTTSFTLAPGQTASFVVKAYNPDGESAGSHPVDGTVTAATPSGATARVEGDQVVVSWNKVNSATGYEVYRNGALAATVPGTENTTHRLPIAAGETMKLAVRAYDQNGKSAATPEVSATRAPAAPTATHTAADNTVTFNWTAPTGATSYKVYLDGNAAETVTGTTKTYTLPYSSTHTFKVIAVNAGGDSDASNTVTMTVVPAAPTGVSATAKDTTATVKWTPVEGATMYHIYLDESDVEVATAFGQGTSQQTVTLREGQEAVFYVRAQNGGGLSAKSAPTSAAAIPAAPTGVTATITNRTATVTWDRMAAANGYEVYKGSVLVKDVSSGDTTSEQFTLTSGETATFSVRSKNFAGTSAATAAPAVTASPDTVTVTGTASGTTLNLSWGTAAGATEYHVHRNGGTAPHTTVAGTTYSDTGLPNGTTYSYTVVAANKAGNAGHSNTVTMTTVPVAPANTVATQTGGSTVRITWTGAAGATAYNVVRSTNGGTTWVNAAVGVTGTQYDDSGLTAGTTYTYAVQATNDAGTSGNSNTSSATPVNPPTAPGNVAAAGTNTRSINVTWTASPNTAAAPVTGHRIYLNGSTTPVATLSATANSHTITGLENGTTYSVVVEAYGTGGATKAAAVTATPSIYAAQVKSLAPWYWWRLDETSGTKFDDASGNNRDAAISGGTATVGAAAGLTSGEGRSVTLVTNSGVGVPGLGTTPDTTFAGMPAGTFTLEAWVKPSTTHEIDTEGANADSATNGTQPYAGMDQNYLFWPKHSGAGGSGDYGVGLSVGTNGVSVYEHASGHLLPTLVWNGGTNALPSTSWTHVAVTYTGKTAKLYINGTHVKTGLASTRTGTGQAPAGGAHHYGGGYRGGVDEIALYNKVLTDTQITANYNAGRTGK